MTDALPGSSGINFEGFLILFEAPSVSIREIESLSLFGRDFF